MASGLPPETQQTGVGSSVKECRETQALVATQASPTEVMLQLRLAAHQTGARDAHGHPTLPLRNELRRERWYHYLQQSTNNCLCCWVVICRCRSSTSKFFGRVLPEPYSPRTKVGQSFRDEVQINQFSFG